MKFVFNPNDSIGKIKFGMEREEIRNIMSGFKGVFKRNIFSKQSADEFEGYYVYYNSNGKCNAVEFFDHHEIVYKNKNLWKLKASDFKKIFPDIEVAYGSYFSKVYSVGVTFDEDQVVSILFGCKDYYA